MTVMKCPKTNKKNKTSLPSNFLLFLSVTLFPSVTFCVPSQEGV